MNLPSYATRFPSLRFDEPAESVLGILLVAEGRLNAADASMHAELAAVWRVIDADPDVNAVLVSGAGKGFSAGGDYALIADMIADETTLLRVWKEARDLVYNMVNCAKPIVAQFVPPDVIGATIVTPNGVSKNRIED